MKTASALMIGLGALLAGCAILASARAHPAPDGEEGEMPRTSTSPAGASAAAAGTERTATFALG